jgi:hypothetical protein
MVTLKRYLASAVVAGVLIFASQGAQAHCDSIDGPVAQAAQKALDTGNVNLVLPFAPESAEPEIKDAFGKSLKVRALGGDAKALADRAFIETTVRLHREGEGAAYTGLKPAGIDYGPAIPAAEKAIESGDPKIVRKVLLDSLEHGLHEKFARVEHGKEVSKEPKTAGEVAHARERVSAELAFVTYVESVRQAAQGAAGHQHKD